MSESLRLAVVVASTRPGRLGTTVTSWFTAQAEEHSGIDVDVVDLAGFDLPLHLGGPLSPEQSAARDGLMGHLAAADAFVVVTPEYNHSFPAPLKNAIDWSTTQWHAKPVAFVSYGGLSGGLRAVEQLRLVFAEMHATTLRDTVSFHGARDGFDQDGRPRNPEACNAAAKVLLDQLLWWGTALKEARAKHPYRV